MTKNQKCDIIPTPAGGVSIRSFFIGKWGILINYNLYRDTSKFVAYTINHPIKICTPKVSDFWGAYHKTALFRYAVCCV